MAEFKLFRKLVWQIIEDYFKERGFERDLSRRLIFDGGDAGSHFRLICDLANYEVGFVRQRVINASGKTIPKNMMIHLGRYVMGEWYTRYPEENAQSKMGLNTGQKYASLVKNLRRKDIMGCKKKSGGGKKK